MSCRKKKVLEELKLPVDCYKYIVKILVSVDMGKTYYYCGNSKYFKSKEDALKFQKEVI